MSSTATSHVAPSIASATWLPNFLQELRSTVRSLDGISCETRVVLADPFAGIARAATNETPALLIIGPHRRQTLRDAFVGTTTERTIHTVASVACPMLMVNAPPVRLYGHVMLTTDLSEGAGRAARTCIALGMMSGADVSFLHVYHGPVTRLAMSHTVSANDRGAYPEEQRKEAARSLARSVNRIGVRSWRQLVRLGLHSTAEEIPCAAKDEAAERIALGTLGRSGVAKSFLGSVA